MTTTMSMLVSLKDRLLRYWESLYFVNYITFVLKWNMKLLVSVLRVTCCCTTTRDARRGVVRKVIGCRRLFVCEIKSKKKNKKQKNKLIYLHGTIHNENCINSFCRSSYLDDDVEHEFAMIIIIIMVTIIIMMMMMMMMIIIIIIIITTLTTLITIIKIIIIIIITVIIITIIIITTTTTIIITIAVIKIIILINSFPQESNASVVAGSKQWRQSVVF